MAVSISNLTSGHQDGSGTSATTASVSPGADKLLLLTVVSRRGDSVNPSVPSVSGNGLTWVEIGHVSFDDTSSSRRTLSLFRAMGASPSTGAITISWGAETQSQVAWVLDECTGMDTTGTDGSGAIVQSATNFIDTGAASLTVTLGAFSDANNATFGSFGNGTTVQVPTAGTGFGNLVTTGNSSVQATSEFQAGNDTSVDMSWSGSDEKGGVAIEIKVAGATTTIINHGNLPLLGIG